MSQGSDDLAFSFRVAGNGDVSILRHARPVTILRADRARDFLDEVGTCAFADQQQLMARLTGNYKRGNERRAAQHPRNRDPGEA